MRYAEFKKLLEEPNNVVVIGDSIAVGINGGASPYAEGGISTVEVLKRVNAFIQTGKAKGATVILSSGASNSSPIELEDGTKKPGNGGLGPVAQQLKALKAAGATVALVGTGSSKSIAFPGTSWTGGKKYMVDLTGVNQQLESMASATGATFLGPLEDFDSGLHSGKGDGIHPYGGYQKIKQAGMAVAPKQSQGSMPATNMKPGEDKMAHAAATQKLTVPTGNVNPEIADLQKVLIALGYKLPKHGVDGVRGPETRIAIQQFQQDNGLQRDGDAGPETISKMNELIVKKDIKFTKSTDADVKKEKVTAFTGPGKQKPLQMDAVTKGKVGSILDFVARYESAGFYDIMNGSQRRPEILKMTLTELIKFQNQYHKETGNSTAAGRYQIMEFNIIPYARKTGLDVNKDIFSPANQDKMGIEFLRDKGLEAWLAGSKSDKDFLEGLSRVWAAIPSVSKGGASYYDKVGNNKSGTTIELALNTLQDIRA